MLAAGVSAALVAFSVSAAADWIWQVPVIPVALLLLIAAISAPTEARLVAQRMPSILRLAKRLVAPACLVAIGIPMATVNLVRQSQAASAAGDSSRALKDAETAARLEPEAASPPLQQALVLKPQHNLPEAIVAARWATHNEATNWVPWYVLSRLEAESGRVRAAVEFYRRARADNPQSSIFK